MEESKNKASICFQNGCRLMDAGNFQQAIEEFDKAISIIPSFDSYQKKYECKSKLGAYLRENIAKKKKVFHSYQEFNEDRKIEEEFIGQKKSKFSSNIDTQKVSTKKEIPCDTVTSNEIKIRFKQIYSDFNEIYDHFKLHQWENIIPDSSEIKSLIVQIEALIELIPSQDSENLKLLKKAQEIKEKGDLKGALDQLTELINLTPPYVRAFYVRADLRRHSFGDLDGAKEDLSKYLEYEPNDFSACVEYADFLGHLNRFEESIDYYKKAISIKTSDTKEKKFYGWGYIYRYIAEDELCLNRFDDAIASLKKAAETVLKDFFDPSLEEVVDIYQEIVEIHIRERKNINDAISSLEEIIKFRLKGKEENYCPNDCFGEECAEFYYTGSELNLISYCEYQLKNYEKVVIKLNNEMDLHPLSSSESNYDHQRFILNGNFILRGQAYLKLGKTKEAYNDWNKIGGFDISNVENYENYLSRFFEENNFSECKEYLSLKNYK